MPNSVVTAKRLAAVALALTFAGVSATGSATSASQAVRRSPLPDPAIATQVRQIYGQLPLSFEANEGQTDPRVKFFSRGNGYSLFLTSDEAVLALRAAAPRATSGASQAVLRMTLVGANPSARVAGLDELPGKSHYFAGRDARQWRTNVPTYEKVSYPAVYPGVDLVYYGNGHHLEYDFIVAPGADPRAIALRFEGAREVAIDQRGDLVLSIADSQIRQPKPVIYQEVDGVRQQVDGEYVMLAKDQVGFEVASYDMTRPLVIDPMLIYSTYLGGRGSDFAHGVAVAMDRDGNAYVTGETNSLDFPTTPGAFKTTNEPVDAFVTKLNRDGSELVYSTFLGGVGSDFGRGIAVDHDGHAYVTGETQSPDFPTTPGAFQAADPDPANSDAFVTKLNRDGSALVYSTYLGGVGDENRIRESTDVEESGDIAVDPSGRAFVTGLTRAANFPTTENAFQRVRRGPTDAFVTKLSRRGSTLIYSTYLGGDGNDEGLAITLPGGDNHDSRGTAFVTGVTDSADFPTTPRAFQPSPQGLTDAYVTKLNRRGSALEYSTYLGGTATDRGLAIAVDPVGQAFVTGGTESADFPTTPGAFQPTPQGGSDAFVTKLNRRGSQLRYSTYLGGVLDDNADLFPAGGIAVDPFGDAYVTGITGSPNFPTTANAFQPITNGGKDVFVTRLNRRGSELRYSTFLGGTGTDFGAGIALDDGRHKHGSDDGDHNRHSRNAYVTGGTSSPNFPTTPGAFQPVDPDGPQFDAFVTKLETADDRDDDDDRVLDDDDEDDDDSDALAPTTNVDTTGNP